MAGAGGGGGGGGVVRDVEALEGVRSIVLKPSESLEESRFTRIAGADFNDPGLGLEGLLASLAYTGFQASNLGDAIDVVNQMVRRLLLFFFFWVRRASLCLGTWGHSNLGRR
jgi:deoxyhypusine synthase